MAYARVAVLTAHPTNANQATGHAESWFNIWLDACSLGFEASSVIGLRVLTIGAGGASGEAEAHRMISEKIEASLTLPAKAVTGRLGMTAMSVAARTVEHYRQKVAENQSRLLGEKR